jgi:hypothetical protein
MYKQKLVPIYIKSNPNQIMGYGIINSQTPEILVGRKKEVYPV